MCDAAERGAPGGSEGGVVYKVEPPSRARIYCPPLAPHCAPTPHSFYDGLFLVIDNPSSTILLDNVTLLYHTDVIFKFQLCTPYVSSMFEIVW